VNTDPNSIFAAALVEGWLARGVTDAVISPGSRSAPLALALLRAPDMRTHVFLDERSAAFFALGLGRAAGRPAVVVCTSGTAGAHFHPAVLEAHHGRVPLIVCTADRPPELHRVGAPQTIEQEHLYGEALRASFLPAAPELATDDDAGREMVRAAAESLAGDSLDAALGSLGGGCGPVHCNLPFREPLVPREMPEPIAPIPGGRPKLGVNRMLAPPLPIVGGGRVLIVAGWGASRDLQQIPAGVPVLADPLSNLRAGDDAIGAYEALLRIPRFVNEHRPDLVVRIGAPLTSRVAMEWLDRSIPQVLIDADHAGLDPYRSASEVITRTVGSLKFTEPLDPAYATSWHAAERAARQRIDAYLDAFAPTFETRVARDVAAVIPDGGALVVGSSMPVRDLDWGMRPRSGLTLYANRGVNGIDGFVSTALGIAAGRDRAPVVALTGDLGFLHDANGLINAAARGLDAVFVVVDNRGGGIFSFLPQGDAMRVAPDEFEQLFGTPADVDLAALASLHGLPFDRVTDPGAVAPTVAAAIDAGGTRVVIVPTDRPASVERHGGLWAAVARDWD
jgi:2-succinyl-5-enolpyruvyl-6-hydroxy-3-cyclohexene-1-carboxylate synthase